MKFDIERLIPQLASHHHAKAHLKACKESSKYLGEFLTWAVDVNKWDFKSHAKWLNWHAKQNKYFPSYSFFLGDEMASFAGLGQGHDFLGRQIVYWTNEKYRGNGVGKEVTEFLMDIAFLEFGAEYLEIHVDQENRASRRIPESLGFKIVNTYECHPHGLKGSGNMNVWGHVNPINSSGFTNETYPWKDQKYTEAAWSMTETALEALQDATQMLKLLGNGSPEK